jgi:hypothetical protein
MDQKLLRRVEAGAALLIALAYFLPWAGILSPFGSIQLRGLYIDYAWLLLLFAVTHLIAQFAEPNREALAIPESWIPGLRLVQRAMPFLMLAFLIWYGTQFSLSTHASSASNSVSAFGTELSSVVHAGLDYGYWIGAFGAVVLTVAVGLVAKQVGRYALGAMVMGIAVFGIAFASSRTAQKAPSSAASSKSEASSSARENTTTSEPVPTPMPDFDASPYLEVSSVTGKHYGKDYDANRYNSSLVITPVFKNIGSKAIVGLQGYLSVVDGFGKEVYGFNFRSDDKLTPGHDSGHSGGYSFEDNPFINDEPYDKMIALVVAGTAKYNVKIKQIAFSDGSVLPEKQ